MAKKHEVTAVAETVAAVETSLLEKLISDKLVLSYVLTELCDVVLVNDRAKQFARIINGTAGLASIPNFSAQVGRTEKTIQLDDLLIGIASLYEATFPDSKPDGGDKDIAAVFGTVDRWRNSVSLSGLKSRLTDENLVAEPLYMAATVMYYVRYWDHQAFQTHFKGLKSPNGELLQVCGKGSKAAAKPVAAAGSQPMTPAERMAALLKKG
jgi:hypothetical protein